MFGSKDCKILELEQEAAVWHAAAGVYQDRATKLHAEVSELKDRIEKRDSKIARLRPEVWMWRTAAHAHQDRITKLGTEASELKELEAVPGPKLRDYTVHFRDDGVSPITWRAERINYMTDGYAVAFMLGDVEIGCARHYMYVTSELVEDGD